MSLKAEMAEGAEEWGRPLQVQKCTFRGPVKPWLFPGKLEQAHTPAPGMDMPGVFSVHLKIFSWAPPETFTLKGPPKMERREKRVNVKKKQDDPIIDRCHREKVWGVYCTSLPGIWLIGKEWLTEENKITSWSLLWWVIPEVLACGTLRQEDLWAMWWNSVLRKKGGAG